MPNDNAPLRPARIVTIDRAELIVRVVGAISGEPRPAGVAAIDVVRALDDLTLTVANRISLAAVGYFEECLAAMRRVH